MFERDPTPAVKMQTRSVLMCVWLVTSVGHSLQTTTPTPSTLQQLRNDGGAAVAQLMQQQFTMINKLHALESNQQNTRRELQAELNTTRAELRATRAELNTTRAELQATKAELNTTRAELQATKAELNATRADIGSQLSSLSAVRSSAGQGSSFIRWGRKGCPDNTTLVYTGVAGGKYYTHKGGGTNRLCLTRSPQFDNTPKPPYYGYLYGSEYDHIPGHHSHDVPCSVCLAPQSTTIMVPATLTCPPEWTPQYSGHLASEYYSHYGGEYVCLDGSLEDDSSGVRDDNGLLFFYVVTVCGSLPCPPYVNDTVVTCVVCSK